VGSYLSNTKPRNKQDTNRKLSDWTCFPPYTHYFFCSEQELHELEKNGLVIREVYNTKPITVQYELTEYSYSLQDVLIAMETWGSQHRRKIMMGE
jgi:hypothetical protein